MTVRRDCLGKGLPGGDLCARGEPDDHSRPRGAPKSRREVELTWARVHSTGLVRFLTSPSHNGVGLGLARPWSGPVAMRGRQAVPLRRGRFRRMGEARRVAQTARLPDYPSRILRKPQSSVILSKAKNLRSSDFKETAEILRRLRLLRMTGRRFISILIGVLRGPREADARQPRTTQC